MYTPARFHLTETDFDTRIVREQVMMLRERPLSPNDVMTFLNPGQDAQRHTSIYQIGRSTVIGNGNHRLTSLYIARIELPSIIRQSYLDDELQEILAQGASRFRKKFGVETVAQFARLQFPDLIRKK